MSPITHLFISWTVSTTSKINRKERALVTLAGVIPDIDGAGLIFDLFSHNPDQPLQLWSKYHHILGHNIGLGLLLVIVTFALSTRRWLTSFFVFISFHLHLLCDLVGAKGPDGYQWPIPYLQPFSEVWQWTWIYQWQLNAWPNFVITAITVVLIFYQAWKYGISPLEIISRKINDAFVATVRNRFGHPNKLK